MPARPSGLFTSRSVGYDVTWFCWGFRDPGQSLIQRRSPYHPLWYLLAELWKSYLRNTRVLFCQTVKCTSFIAIFYHDTKRALFGINQFWKNVVYISSASPVSIYGFCPLRFTHPYVVRPWPVDVGVGLSSLASLLGVMMNSRYQWMPSLPVSEALLGQREAECSMAPFQSMCQRCPFLLRVFMLHLLLHLDDILYNCLF